MAKLEPIWPYLRKSRALGEADDPSLLATHRDLLCRLIVADGHTLPERFYEEIGSAENIDARPIFLALLAEIERLPPNSGGLLYVVDLLRLTRGSGTDWDRIQTALTRAGIRVRTRARLFDPRDPDDLTWMEFEAFFGRMELRYMKARAALKRAQMVRDGQVRTGQVPFGYTWDEKTKRPVPEPQEFPLLQYACREIFTRSGRRIAREIGVAPDRLLLALHNPMICGWPAQRFANRPPGRPPKGYGWRLPRAEWTWPERAGDYPAACTRAEWEAIQDVIAGRWRERSKTGDTNGWCRDVLQFEGSHGRVRLGTYSDSRSPVQTPTYDLIRQGQPALYLARAMVHDAAVETLAGVFSRPQGLAIVQAALHQQEHACAPHSAPGRSLEAIQRDVSHERRRLASLKEAEFDPDEENRIAAKTAQETVRARLRTLKIELERAEKALGSLPDLTQAAPLLAVLVDHFPAVWQACTDSERRIVVRALIAAIRVRVQPRRGSRPAVREILGVDLHDWVPR